MAALTLHHQASAGVSSGPISVQQRCKSAGSIAGRFTSVLSSTRILLDSDAHSPAT